MSDKPLRRTLAARAVLAVVPAAPEEAYGLQISRDAGLPSGTVHPILSRLERYGYVTSRWEDGEASHGEGRAPRRYYRLTDSGRDLAARWAASV